MEGTKNSRKDNGKLKIRLMENEYNSLFSILDAFVEADADSSYGKFASEMQKIIINFGREYEHKNEKHIEINLYAKEAQNLINLFIVFESVFHKPKENYFEKHYQNKHIYN